MKQNFKKLFLGKPEVDNKPVMGGLKKRLKSIRSIWHNEHQDDIGIEKMLRLFLAVSQFVFLGIYIKHIFGKRGMAYQELAVDFFVLFKVIFPVVIIYYQLLDNVFIYALMVWFMLETVFYLSTLVFASDIFSRPRSYRRSMLLMFLNYFQLVFSYAAIYAHGNYLNTPFRHWYDSIYFSFATSSTVGYGEFYPITFYGKLLVSSQMMIFFIFIVMFINFFSNKVEHKGYFDHTNSSD